MLPHRDLSAQNVLLTSSHAIKLCDFGVSRQLASVDALAETSCGTPYYLAPELVSGKPYTWPADAWAVGVLLFELVTLQRPFAARNFITLAIKIANGGTSMSLLSLPAACRGN